MPASSASARTPSVGSTPSDWSTSSCRSPRRSAGLWISVRQLIWWFYRDLKAWQRAPDRRRAAALRARFERILKRRTGYATLDRLLARPHARKAELLCVLDRPEIPLHTNHRGPVIRLRLGKPLALEWAGGERPMPLWWRRAPYTNLAHGLRRA
jgi:hypothetical protein